MSICQTEVLVKNTRAFSRFHGKDPLSDQDTSWKERFSWSSYCYKFSGDVRDFHDERLKVVVYRNRWRYLLVVKRSSFQLPISRISDRILKNDKKYRLLQSQKNYLSMIEWRSRRTFLEIQSLSFLELMIIKIRSGRLIHKSMRWRLIESSEFIEQLRLRIEYFWYIAQFLREHMISRCDSDY